ncbi:MAG TPA: methyltransferase domain-containing protein [Chthoniobacterales bacterium]|jgi:ubiquinone/menaquinone biosynthesis C-methylase UbiE|nr:methyltransferase domain-containing protein [Chthoniobacterales bacterium]
MTSDESHPDYFFGNTDAEHERLIRQAIRLAPVSERFFRDAGIAPGHRVLELGSGVGDVAMLVARIVGRSGEVLAVERDARTISRARARAAEAGLHNINFVQTDIAEYSADSSFDAAVGRCILQFLPDPVAALRSVAKQVRPDGIVAFQEVSWAPCVSLSAHLPLWSAAVSLVHEAGIRSGVNMEMGPALHNAFQEAGLPAPRMRLEMELRRDPEFTRWVSDLLRSVLPQIQKLNLLHEALGDFDTLQERLQDEVAISNTVVPWIGLVAAWCRKPVNA